VDKHVKSDGVSMQISLMGSPVEFRAEFCRDIFSGSTFQLIIIKPFNVLLKR
jgi:hypothetical protein